MRHRQHGFTLIELAIVVLIFGIVVGFSVPMYQQLNRTNSLRGAAENMAAGIRLARQRALSTGVSEHVHIGGSTYWFHPVGAVTQASTYPLPNGVTFSPPTLSTAFTMSNDGRSSASQAIQLTNIRGDTLTVSVELSGLVSVY